jgi:hypothetical protein
MSELSGTLNDFLLGLKGQFPSLEDALCKSESERKLIRLESPLASYDDETHCVYYMQDGSRHALPIDPAFYDYMRGYANRTLYVTDKGTPWLTRAQEELQGQTDEQQIAAYYTALCGGENREVAMLNWSNTNLSRKDTGHAALSVGSLNLTDGSLETDDVPIYDYEPEISGSYYASTTPFLGTKHIENYLKASRERRVADTNPVAHAAGTTVRDSVPILSVLLGGTMASLAIKHHNAAKAGKSERELQRMTRKAIGTMGTLAAVGSLTAATGIFSSANGTLLMKEEKDGSGILATLITPAQRDIMEHSLYGVYLTYHQKYDILNHNCADFAQQMFEDININLTQAIDDAKAQRGPRSIMQRITGSFKVPAHIQPGRMGWALRHAKPETATIEIEPETQALRDAPQQKPEILHVSPITTVGESSVLIEKPDRHKHFREPPIETFKAVMKQALSLQQDPESKRYHFAFQPHVQAVRNEPAATHSR